MSIGINNAYNASSPPADSPAPRLDFLLGVMQVGALLEMVVLAACLPAAAAAC